MIDTIFDTLFSTRNGRPAQVIQYVPMTCCACGVRFALDHEHYAQLVRHPGKEFYCPNGHRLQFNPNKSEADKLRAELAKEAKKREVLETRLRAEREAANEETRLRQEAERKLKTTRAAKTRLQNRIKNGVCPCCNRQFADLHRHMNSQHPEYGRNQAPSRGKLPEQLSQEVSA